MCSFAHFTVGRSHSSQLLYSGIVDKSGSSLNGSTSIGNNPVRNPSLFSNKHQNLVIQPGPRGFALIKNYISYMAGIPGGSIFMLPE